VRGRDKLPLSTSFPFEFSVIFFFFLPRETVRLKGQLTGKRRCMLVQLSAWDGALLLAPCYKEFVRLAH